MQGLTTGVQGECAFVLCDMDVQSDVGIRYGDIRTFARLLTELVDDGVLDFISYEFGVSELLGENHRVNSKGGVQAQESGPVHLFHSFIDIIC